MSLDSMRRELRRLQQRRAMCPDMQGRYRHALAAYRRTGELPALGIVRKMVLAVTGFLASMEAELDGSDD